MIHNLINFVNSFVKNAQALSLDDMAKPEDIDNYRSEIVNTLFISQDDANINNWNPQTNQNIGKPNSTAPTTRFQTKL